LIIESLSPGTDRDDVFVKLPAYQRIVSLQEILYVEIERVGATAYRRIGENWATTTVGQRVGFGSKRSNSISRLPISIAGFPV
jgi:Uma2 family endonuclease